MSQMTAQTILLLTELNWPKLLAGAKGMKPSCPIAPSIAKKSFAEKTCRRTARQMDNG